MGETGLGDFVRAYIDRVVNQKDLSAVEELVSPEYRGAGCGWPGDLDALRRFYADQVKRRPDWRIDVQETIEVGEWVAVHARAGGMEGGRRRDVEWLATYRVSAGRVAEIRVLELKERDIESSPG
jgi:predicted SnoaL-like aldol condensation-catalyzing enzyme